MKRYYILGMPVDRADPAEFADRFIELCRQNVPGYVCVPNVQQCVMAYDDPTFADVLRGAAMIWPDSTVLQGFVKRKYKLPNLTVLRGDQIMLQLCRRCVEARLPVALIGGKDQTLLERLITELQLEVPGLDIAFAHSPPFREPTASEEQDLQARIMASGCRAVFVGIGGGKQERWMAHNIGRVPLAMIGVGAAFDWISGEVRRSPHWVHSAGLEWLHRLASEPRRLWKRYLSTSPRFLWLYARKDKFLDRQELAPRYSPAQGDVKPSRRH